MGRVQYRLIEGLGCKLKVQGNINSIQNSLDFYLNLTSTEGVNSVEDLRKKFLNQFLAEEREQSKDLLENEQNELERLNLEKEKTTIEMENTSTEIQNIKSLNNEDILTNIFSSIEQESKVEEQEDIFSNGNFFLSQVRNSMQQNESDTNENGLEEEPYLEKEESNYQEHGLFLEDLVFEESIVSENINNEKFQEHGVFLEDLVFKENLAESVESDFSRSSAAESPYPKEGNLEYENLEISTDSNKVGSCLGEEYQEHGIFLEDMDFSKTDEDATEVYQEKEQNDFSILDDLYSSLLDEEDEELEVQKEILEESNSETYTENRDFIVSEDSEVNDLEEDIIEGAFDLAREIEGDLKQKITLEDTLSEEKDDFFDLSKGVIEEVEETSATVSSENLTTETEIIESKSDNIEIPSDIRVFLKEHLGSSVDFVSKYYSSKEIEKAIKLGRIYKKKGKLFI